MLRELRESLVTNDSVSPESLSADRLITLMLHFCIS